jgi:hypothetical protein
MKQCQWCEEFFDMTDKPKGWMANHTRWCDKNPKKADYLSALKKRDSVKQMIDARKKSGVTNQFIKAKQNGIKLEHPLKGMCHPNPFKNHTEESKQKIKKAALKSNHRRLRKGMVNYNGTLLDSSWELALAIRLDELKINWIRPNPIVWIDSNNIEHNYFPDFYLTDYNIFLDPKNPAAYQNQIEKIEILKKTFPNLRFIRSLKECKEFEIKNFI